MSGAAPWADWVASVSLGAAVEDGLPFGCPCQGPNSHTPAAIASYGRALETRDVESVRRAYPGLTATQAQGWRDFFGSVSSLKTNLHITQSNVTGDQADASVEGSFQYVQDRRSQTQPQFVTATCTDNSSKKP